MLGHDTHGHAEETKTGCIGFLQTIAEDVSHGGNVFGVISASYTDKGGPGGVPALTTTAQTQIRQRKQEVEHVVTQSGHQHGDQHRRAAAARTAAASPPATGSSSTARSTWSTSTRSRSAWPTRPRAARAGSPLAAVELRTGSASPGRSWRRTT